MWIRAVALVGIVALALPATALAATGQQISVNGTGGASVPEGATDSQQQAAYDQALTAAIGDAQAKAQMVAHELSLTLGPVETFTEQSDDYLGYCGIGFVPVAAAPGDAHAPAATNAPNGQLTPIPRKHRKHRSKRAAQKAQTSSDTCELEADVTVVYSAS